MSGLPSDINPEEPPYSLYEGIEYKEFWNGTQKRNLDELEHAIICMSLPKSGRRIIDVGCGYGRLADCYMDRFQQVIMVDGSISLLRQAIEKTRGQAVYIASDVTHLPFKTASFDTVLMIRVFHHIEDSRACFSELHRLLCNNGQFVFSYCNKQNVRRVFRWLIGSQAENPFTKEPSGLGSTIISHNPKAIQGMLSESGFSGMQYYGVGVLDRFAGKISRGGKWIKLAEQLAPFFAMSKVAPWILCQATAMGTLNYIDVNGIDNLLQCPSCSGNLCNEIHGYKCAKCNKRYPIEDGIIDMRVK